MTRDDEAGQLLAVLNVAQACANRLSTAGEHVSAAAVQGAIQACRALFARLAPPTPEPETT